MRSSGKGFAPFHCRYHVQYLARHGSHWCPTYKAGDLRPYLQVATAWLKAHRDETPTAHTIIALQGLLETAGEVWPAQDIKRLSPARRARVAFARLRDAHVSPERLLAIHMAVSALIEDDMGSHRVGEFRRVQVAKAAHRLASGTHRHWDFPLPNGTTSPLHFHAYPKSSGRVLRVIGKAIEEACGEFTEQNLQAIRDAKQEKYGPHPSSLPGWRSLWVRRRAGEKV